MSRPCGLDLLSLWAEASLYTCCAASPPQGSRAPPDLSRRAVTPQTVPTLSLLRVAVWGICVKRDRQASVRYSERVNARKSSFSLQRTDRHYGIVGQERCHFQCDS
jgi:hypothetical protein